MNIKQLTKYCSNCKIEKSINEFFKCSRLKSGLRSQCKLCQKKYLQEWLRNNPDYMKNWLNKWRKENPEKVKKHLKTKKQEKCRQKCRNKRRQNNPRFKLDTNMATAISLSLKGKKAGRSWQNLVGYTIKDLVLHLEKQFDDKMTWENYGSYWWIDHIKPRSLFNYETPEDPEFKECWVLENLQPLEKIANIKKSNYYE
jgi:hypothetical protein